MGFSVCVSSEAASCSSLSSLLPLLRPSRPRLMPSTATATDSRTPMASPMLVCPSDLPLVWTPSPRELFPLPTTMARGPLTPTTSVVTLSLVSPSDPPLVWTPSPRVLMPPPRDMLLTPTATSDTDTDISATTARGPLMPRLTPTTLVVMPTLVSPSDPPPVWTPSPRDLMHLPRDTLLTPTVTSDTLMATSDTTTVKF